MAGFHLSAEQLLFRPNMRGVRSFIVTNFSPTYKAGVAYFSVEKERVCIWSEIHVGIGMRGKGKSMWYIGTGLRGNTHAAVLIIPEDSTRRDLGA